MSALDYISIRNTISTYCLALDTKDWALLKQVFTPDVDTLYPFRKEAIQGVENVISAISNRLKPITSQHALTTQIINIAEDGQTAMATTYFTGIHFGVGKWEGESVTAWGKYDDELVLNAGKEGGVPGGSGHWLICRRDVTFMGRRGEEGVMEGE